MFQNLHSDIDHSTSNSTTYHAAESPSPSPSPTTNNPTAARTPTNDDIEAVIQMATSTARNTTDGRSGPPRDTRTQLFVGNLPYRVRWQDLKDLFRKAGTVLRADVSLGPDNRSRGYGTVLLATAEDAGRAVDMYNGYEWQTRVLEVRPDRLPGASIGQGASGMGIAGGMVGSSLDRLGAGNRDYLSSTPSLTTGSDLVRDDIDFAALHRLQSPSSSMLSASATSSTVPSSGFPQHASPNDYPFQHSLSPQDPPANTFQHSRLHIRSVSHSLLEQSLFDQSPGLEQRPGTSGTIGSGLGSVPTVTGGGLGLGGFNAGFSGAGLGGNPPNRTLFVGNLPFHVQWQDLKDLFRLSGPVLRADVALAADGRSRGFGTVVFRTEEEAERARRFFDGYDFNGRTLKVHFDKFSQSQAQLGAPYDLSLPPLQSSLGATSSMLSSRQADDFHVPGVDFDDAESRLYSPANYHSLLHHTGLSTPVSPMLKEQSHASPKPIHAANFSTLTAAAAGSSQSFSPFTHSLPMSQAYSPVHQHSFSSTAMSNNPSSSSATSPSLQSTHSYSQPLVPPSTHRNSRVGNGDAQTTSLSLPESLVPTSYPSPTPSSALTTSSSLAELLLQSSSSGSSTASILDRLPSSISGMPTSGSHATSSTTTASRIEGALAVLQERESRRPENSFESSLRDQDGLRSHHFVEDGAGFGNRDLFDVTSPDAWEREWGKRKGWGGERSWREGSGGDDVRRARSTSHRETSRGLDVDGLLHSLSISRGEEEEGPGTGSGMLDKGGTTSDAIANIHPSASHDLVSVRDRETSAHTATRAASLVGAITTPEKGPHSSTTSWSPTSTSASRSASAANSSRGVSSLTSSSVTSDQHSPKNIQAASPMGLEDVSKDTPVLADEDAMKRRTNSDSAVPKSTPVKPVQHSFSQPAPTQSPPAPSTKNQEPASPSSSVTTHHAGQQQRRPGMRSPRHAKSSSQSQQPHQHPHHPGPIVLPPPVNPFMPPPHTLSPHGMMMGIALGSPLHHPGGMSPVYHPGAHTTPTNATTAAMAIDGAAGPGFAFGPHGLHPSIVPMTPHGLPPITPSMPPFSFLPQPSPMHHHPDAGTPGMHYPPMMSMGMGGVTLGGLPSSPTQSSFTPTTHGPSSPHHHVSPLVAQYQNSTHPAHHMVTAFSPGVAMSPGSVYRPGGPSNPFINPAVGAPVHMHGHPPPLHSPGGVIYGYGFSPGEVALGQEPGGYFDTVYMHNGMHYGTIGGRSTDVASEIMRSKEEGQLGEGNLGSTGGVGGQTADTVHDTAGSPNEVDNSGESKPSRTHSFSSKRPEGPFLMQRSDSDPSMTTPGATATEFPVEVKEG